MYELTEWGVSNEPADVFAKRNRFEAQPKYPQDLKSGREVHFCKGLPYLPITGFENADWEKMHWEAEQLEKHYVPHRKHESHDGWSSLCIHGLSSVHTEAHHTYGYKDRKDAPYRWTDVADWCPTIRDFFENQFDYDDYDRIRIMKLSPGGYIIPHKDSVTEDEDHTLGNIISYGMQIHPSVQFCGYNTPHPLKKEIHFHYKLSSGNINNIIKEVVSYYENIFDNISEKIAKL